MNAAFVRVVAQESERRPRTLVQKVEVVRHFAVVASFSIKFGASWGEFTIINCRPNSGGGECTSAEYLVGFEVVVVEVGDVSDAPGHRGCNGLSSGHPSMGV